MARNRSEAAEQHPSTWSKDALADAVRSATPGEKRERLRRLGIVTAEGTLAPKYQSWGKKVSRTPET